MSIHIGALKGEIAETVLLPGDPLRARFVAETFLQDAVCYNEVRGMLGFTGLYKGRRVSVQGTGMGIPSHLIYVHELLAEYGVKRAIRVGSCGAMQPDIRLNDILIAMSASTDSHINRLRFHGADYAPCADYGLFARACSVAEALEIPFRAGNILSSDVFYGDDPQAWKLWADFGVLAVEMETSGLYTEAARFKAQALSILTVSDSLLTGQALSSTDRERSFRSMMELALELA
ncbi:MAG: purine-nucleoside phosphorylase [Spirochaetaceae bacterium]|nr:MAG: purine-nucleoside phosphorylase [Spirochaetaceae bacterium]